MSTWRPCWLGLVAFLAFCFIQPRPAQAIDLNEVDVENRSYLVFVLFLDFLNGDCFQFGEDDEFTGSYGLFIGDWSYESETVALFFTINYVQVELLSASEAVIKGITGLDNTVMVGSIETDDGDNGYFIGFESQICRIPAREIIPPTLTPVPDPFVPVSRTR